MITKKKLSQYLNISMSDLNYGTDSGIENPRILEITNNEQTSIEYFIGDFRESKLGDSCIYLEELAQLGIDTKPLLIFPQWEDEQIFLELELSNKDYTGKQKKETKILFERARIVYFSDTVEVSMSLEKEGVNYLEYETANVDGFIYNISLIELKKLYNITGKNLFKDNVRIGVSNPKAMRLKKEFENTFEIGLYHLFKQNKSNLIPLEDIEDYLNSKLISNYENKEHILDEFWFHHNGITIFSDANYKILGQQLSLSPYRVSVINGAQTLTHCFSLIREIKRDWIKKFNNQNEDIIKKLVDELQKKITLKVIFLKGNIDLKQTITHGLNHQIPIDQEDIQANSDTVEKINKILSTVGMKICRDGEYIDHQNNFSLVEMLKNYLIYISKPGEARNMTKKDLEKKLLELLSFVSESSTEQLKDFSNTMSMFFLIDSWWKKRIPIEETESTKISSIDGLNRNGKYYFKAYCKKLIVLSDFETQTDYTSFFQFYFEKFLNTFINLSPNDIISSNTLKKDNLFEIFLLESETKTGEMYEKTKIDINELKKYMIEHKESSTAKSNHSNLIKSYLRDSETNNILFRTITFLGENPTEYFPFSSNTFKEFYSMETYPECYSEDQLQFSYEDSYLKKAIEEKFNLFVITIDKDKNIIDLELFEDISFIKYTEKAKIVFNKTLEAFKSGDADLFIKPSDQLSFHIRPKALNSQDTFAFTNGDQEIKRTFWANKETISDLIESN
nr:hypothetical protein [Carnobacterium maltaromaticum]